jgi:thiamine pyrophosphokinase
MDALVICGGGPVEAILPTLTAPLVVAADGGAANAFALGLRIDVVVGDLDSITEADLEAAQASGAEVERHPADKDATDLELAIARAHTHGADRIVVAGGGGGRFDMLLANGLVLASERWTGVQLDAVFGGARVTVVRTRRELAGAPGSTVSLLPIGGPAEGVRTDGLRWALDGETLLPGSTRGVSNEFADADASVSIERGVLLAVQP